MGIYGRKKRHRELASTRPIEQKREENKRKIEEDEKQEKKKQCFENSQVYLYNSIGLFFLAGFLSVLIPTGIYHLGNLIHGNLNFKDKENKDIHILIKIFLLILDLIILSAIILFIVFIIKLIIC